VDKIISTILGSSIICLLNIFMWGKLYENKLKLQTVSTYLYIFILIVLLGFNYLYMISYIKVLTAIILFNIFNWLIYRKTEKEVLISTFVSYTVLFVSEIFVSLFAFAILKIDMNKAKDVYIGTLKINIIISLITLLIVYTKFPAKIYNFLIKITDKIDNSVFTALILLYSYITFRMLQQKNRYIKMSNKYNMTNTTLKELEQNVSRLKITNHENKNQLLTIRNMIKKGENNKILIKHIENIVNTKIKDDETLMLQTSTITNSMISSIVYSKMLTMKENDVDAALIISRDIKDLYLSDIPDELAVEVCKIIGVYLDNALEEVSKYEEKIINIEFYAEKKTLCIAISNNFEGEIDFEKMDNPGYTTKENGHGYGLSLAHEIIESNDRLSSEREIKDNIFKQILKIKM
jgi:two-component system sensor histidine kinase AgrC